MKQFFKILALAALALPFTGCDVEYSDINILPDPVFEQNGLYTVNTISIYDDYETVINVSRTAGLSKELELDIVVDETLLAEYNELYNTDYKLLEAQFYDIPKNAQLASTVKSVDSKGAVIDLGNEAEGYLRASEISSERVEDATTKLNVGDPVEAVITSIDRKNRNVQLSIKAKDAAETREALNRVNSDATTGTTNLGALLKAKLEKK